MCRESKAAEQTRNNKDSVYYLRSRLCLYVCLCTEAAEVAGRCENKYKAQTQLNLQQK